MDLYKNYNEFATYYETLSKLVSIKPKGELIELDATAKANYIKEIENIKVKFQLNIREKYTKAESGFNSFHNIIKKRKKGITDCKKSVMPFYYLR